jgi:hypothetical protein
LSSEETLIAAGAECVGGDLILKHEVMARYRDGVMNLTLAGHAWLAEHEKEKTIDKLLVLRQYLDAAPVPDDLTPFDPDIGDYTVGEPTPAPTRRGRKPKADK